MSARASALFVCALLLTLAAAPAAAQAASVAFVEGNNVWLSSPDGAQRKQLTTTGTDDAAWNFPVQGADGKTIASHRDAFEDGSRRPVLYLFGPDGKQVTANVMPVYSGANLPVYPIGMDMDWKSNAVAYGYSYCGFACGSVYRGYWLTFSDQQGLYPTDPQGQSDALNPTFINTRVISSDSGGSIFVQPDVPEAPFTSSYTGWLSSPSLFLSRVSVAETGRQVAIEWAQYDSSSTLVDEGFFIGQHQGSVPSDVTELCRVPTAAGSNRISFSPDGTMITWQDNEGVKVAGAPNLAAGTDTCALSSPTKVISASGRSPDFGGGDVKAMVDGGTGPATTPGGDPGTGGGGGTPSLDLVAPRTARRAAFKRGLKVKVKTSAAGKISGSATIPAKLARKLKIGKAATAAVIAIAEDGKGFAAAKTVVVARGSVTAKGAGTVTITFKPTSKAKRAIARMKGVTLLLKVSEGAASDTAKVKLK